MANSNKLLKSKVCDRGPYSVKTSSDQSRFHQYCSSTSVFPPLPPVTTLTAAQRLKRFKAICKKQPLVGSNRVKDNSRPGKKSLGTLVVRKKGLRKSLVATPGKSPFIRSARKKTIGRKSLKHRNPLLSLKMTEVGMNSETFDLNSGTEPYIPENIHEFKKEVSKKIFIEERNLEHETSRPKLPGHPFIEFPESEDLSSDSAEIDVVNGKYEIPVCDQLSFNGRVNGGSNGLDYPATNGVVGHENGVEIENPEISSREIPEEEVLNSASKECLLNEPAFEVDSKVVSKTENEVSSNFQIQIDSIDPLPWNLEVNRENGSTEKTEMNNSPEQNQENAGTCEEDASFDAVLQAPVETEFSNEVLFAYKEASSKFVETATEDSADTVEEKTDSGMFVTAEVHAEAIPDNRQNYTTEQNDVIITTNEPPVEISFEVNAKALNEKGKKKKSKKSISVEPTLKLETPPKTPASKTQGSSKAQSSQKVKASAKTQAPPKTQESPRKKPQKRKSSPARAIKPKNKKESLSSVSIESEIHSVAEIKRKSSPEPEISPAVEKTEIAVSSGKVEESLKQSFMGRRSKQSKHKEPASCSNEPEVSSAFEKEEIAGPSSAKVEEPKQSSMVRRSKQLKLTEPASSIEPEKSEKTPVSNSINTSEEPPTSRSLRRTQRSFSPSRRAPLRSVRRGAGTGTPQASPPLKRKAETVEPAEDTSSKRVKNEVFSTPRWNFLSSPLKSYWSPQLTNKISYKQPVTPTPERLPESSDEETPTSSESPNTPNTSKNWCTIA